jgi:hypothetical protein
LDHKTERGDPFYLFLIMQKRVRHFHYSEEGTDGWYYSLIPGMFKITLFIMIDYIIEESNARVDQQINLNNEGNNYKSLKCTTSQV